MLRTTGAQQPLQNTQAPAHKPFRRQKSHWATIFKRLLTLGHQWGIAHPAACDKSEVTFLMLKFSSVTLRWMSLSDYTQRNPKPSCSFPRGEKKLFKGSCFSFSLLTYNCHQPLIKLSHYLPRQGRNSAEGSDKQSALWGDFSLPTCRLG